MSWKKFGGIRQFDTFNNLNVNSIATDEITIRDAYKGTFTICGELFVDEDSFLSGNASIEKSLVVDNDIYAKNSIIIGTNNNEKTITTNASGLGINVENPTALLDLSGSADHLINVYSNSSSITTTLLRNPTSHSIVSMDNSGAMIDFSIQGNHVSFVYDHETSLMSFNKDISFSDSIYGGGDLTIRNNGHIGNNFTVLGNVDLRQDVSMNGSLNVSKNATIQEHVVIGNSVSIGNNTTILGNLLLGRDLTVHGKMDLGGDISFNGNITSGGYGTFQSYVSVGGALTVNGNTTIGGNIVANGDIRSGGELELNGNVTIHGNHGIFIDSLKTNDAIIRPWKLNEDTTSTGIAVIENALYLNTPVVIGGNLYIDGSANFVGTITQQGGSGNDGGVTLDEGYLEDLSGTNLKELYVNYKQVDISNSALKGAGFFIYNRPNYNNDALNFDLNDDGTNDGFVKISNESETRISFRSVGDKNVVSLDLPNMVTEHETKNSILILKHNDTTLANDKDNYIVSSSHIETDGIYVKNSLYDIIDMVVGNNVSINGNLTVENNILGQSLNIESIIGNVISTQDIAVSGNATINHGLNIGNWLTISNEVMYFNSGNLILPFATGLKNVVQEIEKINSDIQGNIIAPNQSNVFKGDINTFQQAVSIHKKLIIGDASLNDTSQTTDIDDISYGLMCIGDVLVGGNLMVDNVVVNENIHVMQDISLNGNLYGTYMELQQGDILNLVAGNISSKFIDVQDISINGSLYIYAVEGIDNLSTNNISALGKIESSYMNVDISLNAKHISAQESITALKNFSVDGNLYANQSANIKTLDVSEHATIHGNLTSESLFKALDVEINGNTTTNDVYVQGNLYVSQNIDLNSGNLIVFYNNNHYEIPPQAFYHLKDVSENIQAFFDGFVDTLNQVNVYLDENNEFTGNNQFTGINTFSNDTNITGRLTADTFDITNQLDVRGYLENERAPLEGGTTDYAYYQKYSNGVIKTLSNIECKGQTYYKYNYLSSADNSKHQGLDGRYYTGEQFFATYTVESEISGNATSVETVVEGGLIECRMLEVSESTELNGITTVPEDATMEIKGVLDINSGSTFKVMDKVYNTIALQTALDAGTGNVAVRYDGATNFTNLLTLTNDFRFWGNILLENGDIITQDELECLPGLTENIQDQLNTLNNKTTFSTMNVTSDTSLNETFINENLTIRGNLILDNNTTLTQTTMEYLSGVTSDVQTQLNNIQAITSFSTLEVFGNTSITGNLEVEQNTTIHGNVNIVQDVSINGMLQTHDNLFLYQTHNDISGVYNFKNYDVSNIALFSKTAYIDVSNNIYSHLNHRLLGTTSLTGSIDEISHFEQNSINVTFARSGTNFEIFHDLSDVPFIGNVISSTNLKPDYNSVHLISIQDPSLNFIYQRDQNNRLFYLPINTNVSSDDIIYSQHPFKNINSKHLDGVITKHVDSDELAFVIYEINDAAQNPNLIYTSFDNLYNDIYTTLTSGVIREVDNKANFMVGTDLNGDHFFVTMDTTNVYYNNTTIVTKEPTDPDFEVIQLTENKDILSVKDNISTKLYKFHYDLSSTLLYNVAISDTLILTHNTLAHLESTNTHLNYYHIFYGFYDNSYNVDYSTTEQPHMTIQDHNGPLPHKDSVHGTLTIQHTQTGGGSSIVFPNSSRAGEFASIQYVESNKTVDSQHLLYDPISSKENSVLFIGTKQVSDETQDNIVIRSGGTVVLDAGKYVSEDICGILQTAVRPLEKTDNGTIHLQPRGGTVMVGGEGTMVSSSNALDVSGSVYLRNDVTIDGTVYTINDIFMENGKLTITENGNGSAGSESDNAVGTITLKHTTSDGSGCNSIVFQSAIRTSDNARIVYYDDLKSQNNDDDLSYSFIDGTNPNTSCLLIQNNNDGADQNGEDSIIIRSQGHLVLDTGNSATTRGADAGTPGSIYALPNGGSFMIGSGESSDNALDVSGSVYLRNGVTIDGVLSMSGSISNMSTSVSNSSSSGALVVSGGVGIGGNVNVAQNIVMENGTLTITEEGYGSAGDGNTNAVGTITLKHTTSDGSGCNSIVFQSNVRPNDNARIVYYDHLNSQNHDDDLAYSFIDGPNSNASCLLIQNNNQGSSSYGEDSIIIRSQGHLVLDTGNSATTRGADVGDPGSIYALPNGGSFIIGSHTTSTSNALDVSGNVYLRNNVTIDGEVYSINTIKAYNFEYLDPSNEAIALGYNAGGYGPNPNISIGYGAYSGGSNANFNNIAIGKNAFSESNGWQNTVIGHNAFEYHNGPSATGSDGVARNNTVVGSQAMQGDISNVDVSGLQYNTAIGMQSLLDLTSNSRFNTALGYNSGYSGLRHEGGYNTFIGANTSFQNAGTFSNSTAIGYNSKIGENNQIVLGTATEYVFIAGVNVGSAADDAALRVSGGAGIGKNLYVANNIVVEDGKLTITEKGDGSAGNEDENAVGTITLKHTTDNGSGCNSIVFQSAELSNDNARIVYYDDMHNQTHDNISYNFIASGNNHNSCLLIQNRHNGIEDSGKDSIIIRSQGHLVLDTGNSAALRTSDSGSDPGDIYALPNGGSFIIGSHTTSTSNALDVSGSVYLRNDVTIDGTVSMIGDININTTSSVTIHDATLYAQGTSTVFGTLTSFPTNVNNNTAFGLHALNGAASPANTAVGSNALSSGLSGNGMNTAIGNGSSESLTMSQKNVSMGHNSFPNATFDSDLNTVIGVDTFHRITSNSSQNTCVGSSIGGNFYNGSYNSFFGASTNVSDVFSSYLYSTALGYGATINASNQIVLGRNTEYVYIPGSFQTDGNVFLHQESNDISGIYNFKNYDVSNIEFISKTAYLDENNNIYSQLDHRLLGTTTLTGIEEIYHFEQNSINVTFVNSGTEFQIFHDLSDVPFTGTINTELHYVHLISFEDPSLNFIYTRKNVNNRVFYLTINTNDISGDFVYNATGRIFNNDESKYVDGVITKHVDSDELAFVIFRIKGSALDPYKIYTSFNNLYNNDGVELTNTPSSIEFGNVANFIVGTDLNGDHFFLTMDATNVYYNNETTIVSDQDFQFIQLTENKDILSITDMTGKLKIYKFHYDVSSTFLYDVNLDSTYTLFLTQNYLAHVDISNTHLNYYHFFYGFYDNAYHGSYSTTEQPHITIQDHNGPLPHKDSVHGTLTIQHTQTGGGSSIVFPNSSRAGEFASIQYVESNQNIDTQHLLYDPDSTKENSVLFIGTKQVNDETQDNIVIRSGGTVVLDAGKYVSEDICGILQTAVKPLEKTDYGTVHLQPRGGTVMVGGDGAATSTNNALDVIGDVYLRNNVAIDGEMYSINTIKAYNFEYLDPSNEAIALGYNAGAYGSKPNISIGYGALFNTSNGNGSNIAIGKNAMSETIGFQNTVIGHQAFEYNKGENSLAGKNNRNTVVGYLAMQGVISNVDVSGLHFNTAIGMQSLRDLKSYSKHNTALGYNSGYSDLTHEGSYNTFIGAETSFSSAGTFSNSTAIGYNSKIDDNNQIVLGTASEYVYIPGILGIGTTNPETTLHIHQQLVSSGNYPAGSLKFSTKNNGGDFWDVGEIESYIAAGSGGSINNYPGGLAFKTKNADGSANTVLTTKMVIDADGNVGIGTENPGYTLDLTNAGEIRTGNAIFFNDYYKIKPFSYTLGLFGTNSNGGIGFYTTDTSIASDAKMYIDNNGNVGIGTMPTTNYKLDVNGHVNMNYLYCNTIHHNGNDIRMAYRDIDPGTSWTNGTNCGRIIVAGPNHMLYINYDSDFSGGTRINSNLYADGNVGIGTTTPNHKLDVRGDIGCTGGNVYIASENYGDSSGGSLTFEHGAGEASSIIFKSSSDDYGFIRHVNHWTDVNPFDNRIVPRYRDVSDVIFGDGTTDNSLFFIGAANDEGLTNSDNMLIRPSGVLILDTGDSSNANDNNNIILFPNSYATGKVGIKNASPSYDLDVNGQIRCTDDAHIGVRLNFTAWDGNYRHNIIDASNNQRINFVNHATTGNQRRNLYRADGGHYFLNHTDTSQNSVYAANFYADNAAGYAFSFDDDSDTGIYYEEANVYTLRANGYEILKVHSANSVSHGYQALYDSLTNNTSNSGSWNSAMGTFALSKNTTGSSNSAFGHATLESNITGDHNAALGNSAGRYSIGSYCTFIGSQTDSGTSSVPGNYDYSTAIGYGAQITKSYQVVLGRSSEEVYIPGNLVVGSADTYIHTLRGELKFIYGNNGNDFGKIYYDESTSNSGKFIFEQNDDGTEEFIFQTQKYNEVNPVERFKITSTGISTSGSATAASFNATSDYRVKENVQTISGENYIVDHLRPVSYTLKNSQEPHIGFIAHELQEHVPTAVKGEKDGEEMQSVNYSELIPILVKEIQDLKARIKVLENRN